jgi:hypothetical protein
MKGNFITFLQFINPVFLALGIIGLLLHFEVEYLDMAACGLGFWGLTGGIVADNSKKNK